jgi:hypothetical protein
MEISKSKYWVSKEQIDMKFDFYGNYYKEKNQNFRNLICYVTKSNSNQEYLKFDSIEYNALFIMMNPGGSEPLNKLFPVRNSTDGFDKMVKAKPDQTQYQVARIALEMKWNAVCVINLSDYIDSESNKFVDYIKGKNLKDINSVINEDRKLELNMILKQVTEKDKVYVAWGSKTHSKYLALVNLVYTKLNALNYNIIGLRNENHPNKNLFLHPLPHTTLKQDEWLDNFIKLK